MSSNMFIKLSTKYLDRDILINICIWENSFAVLCYQESHIYHEHPDSRRKKYPGGNEILTKPFS